MMKVKSGDRYVGLGVALSENAASLRDVFAARLRGRLDAARLFIGTFDMVCKPGRPDMAIILHSPTKNVAVLESLVRDVAQELELLFYADERTNEEVVFGGIEAVHFRKNPFESN